jgi:diguanylate cyclase (GGDEF)-like protein
VITDRFRGWIDEASVANVGWLAAISAAAVAAADYALGPQVSSSYFYVFPLSVLAWRLGRRAAVFSSVAAAFIWLGIDLATGPDRAGAIPIWNAGIRLAFFLTISLLLVGLRAALARTVLLARTDALTGLLNRRAFEELADREFSRIARTGQPLTAVMMDLDDFKSINDAGGHAAGDEALQKVASVLASSTRDIDIAGRLGGDEFAILVIGDETAGENVLARLSRDVAAHSIGGRRLSCSIGAHTARGGVLDDAMRTADRNLYTAKDAGKGRVVATTDIMAGAG